MSEERGEGVVTLAPGREKSLRRRHPWVFAGAVARAPRGVAPGATVEVVAADGSWLGRGAWSPASQIRVRIWSFEQGEGIDGGFFRRRLAAALAWRDGLPGLGGEGGGMRLVNAESDGLPGVVVDRYADHLVCRFTAVGAECWRGAIVDGLRELLPGVTGIWERSEGESRGKEGLSPRSGWVWGVEPPPEGVEFREGGLRLLADPRGGHKTGFYLDQQGNRRLAGELAAGRRVLNAFSYTGAFGCHCLAGGASEVVQVESSAPAQAVAARHLELNGLESSRCQLVTGNAFQVLRGYREAGRRFDLVILDPPKLAESAAQVARAARAYKDANLLAWQLLAPGGVLMTFSCSGHMEEGLFQKIVADAALDAGREGRIGRWLGAGADHPVGLAFPEGRYLKGLLCRAAG